MRREPVQPFLAWGAFFGALANVLNWLFLGHDISPGHLLGAALGGAFFGSLVWRWRKQM